MKVLAGAALALAGCALVPTSASADAPLPVPYSPLSARLAPAGTSPPGANDFGCRPSAAHPRPVVLLHGVAGSMTETWATAAPLLRNHGYCVFALTYGALPDAFPGRSYGGLDHIATSADQLAGFVDRVLASTGAGKVDLVGYSEGGWLGREYIQFHGGSSKVDRYVGLAPANGPTNFSQLVFAFARLSPAAGSLVRFDAAAISVLVPLVGEAFNPDEFDRLNAGGGTAPGVTYTNIASRYDELVPPAAAFVPTGAHVTNIVLQDGCPIDFTDHVAFPYTRRAMGLMLNALDPTHATALPCVAVLPVLG